MWRRIGEPLRAVDRFVMRTMASRDIMAPGASVGSAQGLVLFASVDPSLLHRLPTPCTSIEVPRFRSAVFASELGGL
jgi:hypothetical protein